MIKDKVLAILKSLKTKGRSSYLIHSLFFFVALGFIGRSISFQWTDRFINGGDTFQWVNFLLFLKKGQYIWEPTATGLLSPMVFWTTPYNAVLELFYLLGGSRVLAINLFWVLLLYLSQLAFYQFFRIFLDKKTACVATLVSIFNSCFLILFHTPVHHLVVAYLALPALFVFFYHYVRNSRFLYAVFYMLFQVILFRTVNILIILNILVPFLYFIINIRSIYSPLFLNFFKKTVIVWVGGMCVSALMIANMVAFVLFPQGNTQLDKYNESALSIYSIDKLENIYRFTTNYGFLNLGGAEYPGLQGKDYSSFYLENTLAISISYLLFFLFIFAIYRAANESRNKLVFLPILIVGLLFLAKGLNEPFPFINEFLLRNPVYVTFFRSGAKYFDLMVVPLIILFTLYILQRSKMRYFLFLYTAFHAFLVFVYSTPIHHSWNSSLPQTTLDVSDTIAKTESLSRILVLPITEHFAGYTDNSDGYSGPERLYTLNDHSLLTKIHSPIISDAYSNAIEEIRVDYRKVNTDYQKLGYNYLLLEKNALSSIYHPIASYELVASVIDGEVWDKVYDNQDYSLYRIKTELAPQILSSTNGQLEYTKVSPVEYRAKLAHVGNQSVITLLETFNKGWVIVPVPIHPSFLSDVSNSVFLSWSGIRYLPKIKVAANTHVQSLAYANSWGVSSSEFIQKLDSSYYEKNEDGTINVSFAVYFLPQAYYVVGQVISLVALGVICGYLVVFRKQENTL